MFQIREKIRSKILPLFALTLALPVLAQQADQVQPEPDATTTLHHIKTVFIILMENHNWTGNGSLNIKGNPEAPYINSTLLPMASYANNYNNPPGNHPSLPNYLWLEAGTNFGIYDDNPPSQDHQRDRKSTRLNSSHMS